MVRFLAPALLLILMAGGTWAEARFRADDGNLWRLDDNPALAAASGDRFAAGFAVAPDGGRWDRGASDVRVLSPLLSFSYWWKGPDSLLRFGTALGPWEGLSVGYRSAVAKTGASASTVYDFGLLWRPFDLFSAGVTLDNAFDGGRRWAGGLALRPLALTGRNGGLVTLTADAAWDGAAAADQRYGVRVAWQGSDLRVWYEPGASVPGFEVTLGLGPSETTGSPNLAGQAFRWGPGTPAAAPFGKIILRIRDAGALASAPPPPGAWTFGAARTSLPALVDLLDRAARDGSVAAVAFENPPSAGGLAAAQDLRASLDRLKAAGKKVYVHAEAYTDSLGFQGWVAAADRVSVDPTGSVWVGAGGSRRLYLKDFFDKIGVRFVNFAPWETKSANNTLTYSSMPEGERAMLKRFLTDRGAQAAEALASGRGDRLRVPAAELVGRGPYLVAQEALDRGLVDGLETRTDFEAFLKTAVPGASLADTLAAPREPGWGPPVARKTAALVHLSGDIVPGPGQAGTTVGRAAAETVRALREDASVAALVLRVDSPGGAVTPSALLADEVKKTVAAGKPVVVVMGDLAASGGYYLSAPASRIFARPGTLTGSIGVTAALFTAEKSLDLLGIKADGVDLAPSSAFGDWTRSLTEASAQKWTGMILATYDRFLDTVAEGRHLDKARLEPLARGQVYTGREALALGLVDELGGQEEARLWLEKQLGADIAFTDVVPGETSPFGGLLGTLASAALKDADSPTLRLAGTLDRFTAPWAEAVTGVAARGGGPLVWMDPTETD